jgi:DNA-binding transcriptional regulator YiaG
MPKTISDRATHEDIKHLFSHHEITRAEAAELLDVSVHTVDSWTAPPSSTKHRAIPLACWEMLLLKLNAHPEKMLIDR